MADLRPLFIVDNKNKRIVIGKAKFHKELVKAAKIEKEDVAGGGCFEFSSNTKEFLLFGKSYDFGQYDFRLVEEIVENKQVWHYGVRNISDRFTFLVDPSSDIVI